LQIWGVPLPSDNTEGSTIDAWFFLIPTIIGLIMLWRRHFSWGAALQLNPWVTALLVFMALSIVWSNYPYISFKRYIKIIGSVTMAMVVLTNDRPHESVLAILRRCFYIHLPMSIICVKYFRDIGVSYDWSGASNSWQGISTSKNTLGQVAMLAVLYFSWDVYLHWRDYGWRNLHVVYLLMGVYLLKGSESEISMTSVSVCCMTLLIFLRLQSLRLRLEDARRFVQKVFWAVSFLVALVIVHSLVMFSPHSIFGKLITTFGKDITLTDRTNIWHDVYAAASGNPLLGVGFGGFWIGRLANIPWNANMTWVLGQAHSGYVDTYLQIGLLGEFLLAAVLLTSFYRLSTSLADDFDFNSLRITIFLAIMFVNITESTYLRGDHHLWLLMQLVIWQVPRSIFTLGGSTNSAQSKVREIAAAAPALRLQGDAPTRIGWPNSALSENKRDFA
jgi:O-antigen ligase